MLTIINVVKSIQIICFTICEIIYIYIYIYRYSVENAWRFRAVYIYKSVTYMHKLISNYNLFMCCLQVAYMMNLCIYKTQQNERNAHSNPSFLLARMFQLFLSYIKQTDRLDFLFYSVQVWFSSSLLISSCRISRYLTDYSYDWLEFWAVKYSSFGWLFASFTIILTPFRSSLLRVSS